MIHISQYKVNTYVYQEDHIRENYAALFGKASCQPNSYNRHRITYGLGEEWRRTFQPCETLLAKAQDLPRSYRCGATAVLYFEKRCVSLGKFKLTGSLAGMTEVLDSWASLFPMHGHRPTTNPWRYTGSTVQYSMSGHLQQHS